MPHKDPEVAREYRKEWKRTKRATNPEYGVSENRKWRDVNPKGYMLCRARARARAEGLPFTITPDDFDIPERCPVFPELELRFHNGRERPDTIPTLDKLVPALGYVPGNVHVISMRANRLKSDATPEELRRIAEWAEGRLKN